MSEKPVYSLTLISDHAKELLNAIDNPPNPSNELYGEKHREPLYTEKQVKQLESMYGYNADRLKKSSKYRMITNGHLLVTKDNIGQIDSDTYFANCVVDFETPDLYNKCKDKGVIFINCVVYPNGVNTPMRLNKDGVYDGEGPR
jgi:myo-inositol-hexaphosphate 3-phosphohydrolase